MKRKCSRCNQWYLDHTGMFIHLPKRYDDRMCRKCNNEIDEEIEKNSQ